MRHRVRQKISKWKECGASGQVLEWIRHGVKIPWKHSRPPPPFNMGASCKDLPPEQAAFVSAELSRLMLKGILKPTSTSRWISRAFLVPKASGTGWRLVIDLRELNRYCSVRRMKMETLKHLGIIAKPGDWWVSFDLVDGFYALGVHEDYRDYFALNINGQIYHFAAIPQGWSLSPFIFQKFTEVFTKHLRDPEACRGPPPKPPSEISTKATRRWFRRRTPLVGARLLPFVDDFALFNDSEAAAWDSKVRTWTLLDELGLEIHATKGHHTPVQVGEHLGLTIDFVQGVFRAPEKKLNAIAKLAKAIIYSADAKRRWVKVKALASLAGKAQFLYLAIPPARFYLRELHDVVGTRRSWSGEVKMTHQLRRDLQWWTRVPSEHNGAPIWRPVETAYLHCDSGSFGWGAVLNETHEARGFWRHDEIPYHITWKELRAVRRAVQSFLPELRGHRLRLHEDNMAVVHILTHLTSKSPVLMAELRKLFYLLDTNGIRVLPRYIRSAANFWADRLSRELDRDDWQLAPRMLALMDKLWGRHTIDRFASKANRQVQRYNAKWRDGSAEAVDCLRLPDSEWRGEVNWCNPPWELLNDLAAKLLQSGAAATVIAPRWPQRPWFHLLSSMATETMDFPPSHDLFSPWRQPGHEGVGPPAWSVVAFKLPFRHGS